MLSARGFARLADRQQLGALDGLAGQFADGFDQVPRRRVVEFQAVAVCVAQCAVVIDDEAAGLTTADAERSVAFAGRC